MGIATFKRLKYLLNLDRLDDLNTLRELTAGTA
jgi:hypothetical protein